MIISFVVPLGMIHMDGLRYAGRSRFFAGGHFVHYNSRGEVWGKTERNWFGEPNHMDRIGVIAGYSRWVKPGIYVHFDSRGRFRGHSRCIGGLIWVSRKKRKRSKAPAEKRALLQRHNDQKAKSEEGA